MNTDRNEPTSPPIMCKNNCGFCGSPANENYCSKCYREHLKRKSQISNNNNNLKLESKVDLESKMETTDMLLENEETLVKNTDVTQEETKVEAKEETVQNDKCHKCKKQVGLLGFLCRCGSTFCSQHRQSNLHDCSFDYKSFNRKQLELKSVKVVADKLQRI